MKLRRSFQKRLWRLFPPQVDGAQIESSSNNGSSKISLRIGGHDIWFSCSGLTLRPSPIAFLILFFPHHLAKGVGLKLPFKLTPGQRKQLNEIARIFSDWWNFSRTHSIAEENEAHDGVSNAPRRRALFFSCGVDSFHSLLRCQDELDDLILVHGFDIELDNQARFDALSHEAAQVARELGKRLIIVRTNLRKHPVYSLVNWTIAHGAALAAVAHLLKDEISHFRIAASYPENYQKPWGSNAETDPLWGDDYLQIRHDGNELWRSEKIAKWGSHPLFQKHLAICWEQRNASLNCGECEKCLRTQIALLVHGHLENSSAFDNRIDKLAKQIAKLPPNKRYHTVYREFLEYPLPREIRNAISNWLARD